jgi:cellulose synthase/poly-beta-1,6-N-acetylglucosamine synthase-like glycosyltransferase
VEADDRETLVAAQAAVDGDAITVIAVPPSSPRTKPKALVWAMPFVDADLVTVYDAEDRPEPDQLRQAAAVFAAATPDLVCLQAVLDIDHAASSSPWLSRQFALEYRVLFRAILPWLAEKQLFLPLGGTSNHFRREALLRIGCWDPFNVTEDVDIAVRIHRAGLSIGTIGSVTHEEAPLTWSAWHWQRTRWMKGWLQTWLVHMRRPVKFYRDLGLADFATFQVLILGQILSALAYPFGAVLIAADIAGIVPLFADRSFFSDVVLAFQLLAMGCGWLGAAAALAATAGKGGRMVRAADILSVPVYWFLLFGAAIHAIAELIVDPHRWNKTGHGFAERTDEIARDDGPLKSSDSRARPHP